MDGTLVTIEGPSSGGVVRAIDASTDRYEWDPNDDYGSVWN